MKTTRTVLLIVGILITQICFAQQESERGPIEWTGKSFNYAAI